MDKVPATILPLKEIAEQQRPHIRVTELVRVLEHLLWSITPDDLIWDKKDLIDFIDDHRGKLRDAPSAHEARRKRNGLIHVREAEDEPSFEDLLNAEEFLHEAIDDILPYCSIELQERLVGHRIYLSTLLDRWSDTRPWTSTFLKSKVLPLREPFVEFIDRMIDDIDVYNEWPPRLINVMRRNRGQGPSERTRIAALNDYYATYLDSLQEEDEDEADSELEPAVDDMPMPCVATDRDLRAEHKTSEPAAPDFSTSYLRSKEAAVEIEQTRPRKKPIWRSLASQWVAWALLGSACLLVGMSTGSGFLLTLSTAIIIAGFWRARKTGFSSNDLREQLLGYSDARAERVVRLGAWASTILLLVLSGSNVLDPRESSSAETRVDHLTTNGSAHQDIRIKWVFRAGGFITSPHATKDVVAITSTDGRLYLLNRSSGKELWRFSVRDPGPPFVAGDRVFVGSYDDIVFSLDLSTGRQKWMFSGKRSDLGGFRSSPELGPGAIYFSSHDHFIYALNIDTGTLKWAQDARDRIEYPPAVESGAVCIGSNDFEIRCIEAASGRIKWTYRAGAHALGPLILDDNVYCASRDRYLYSLALESGKIRWKFRSDRAIEMPLASQDNLIFATTYGGSVYALDSVTGRVVWHYSGDPVETPASVTKGFVVFSDNKNTHVLDSKTGKEIRTFTTVAFPGARIAAIDGALYLANREMLYAIELQ